jgi:hypothetical protein
MPNSKSVLMSLSKAYPNRPSRSTALILDTLISAAFYFAGKWSPELKRNQSRDVLRLLLYKLYAPPGGSLFHRHARSSHAALAASCSLSRVWTCELISRLRSAGWIETHAPRLAGSQQQDISQYRPGRLLKRLLVMLTRSRERQKSRVNDRGQKVLSTQEVERNKTSLAKLIAELGQKLGPPGTNRRGINPG